MMTQRLYAVLASAVIAPLLFSPKDAAAQYRLQGGDVIEISVAGLPEMRQRSPVQLDGFVSFAIAGTIMVEGVTLSDLRQRIQAALTKKVMRVPLNDGREISRTVEPDEIAVSVVEYKPIFVTGQVARPGEQSFRPRMTARQAIVAAGGTSENSRNGAPQPDFANLRSGYIAAWLSAATEEARLLRVRMELGENIPFKLSLPNSPVADSVITNIIELERETAKGRNAAQDREREYYSRAIKEADLQIEVLTKQQAFEEQGAQADAADLKRAMDMYGKGALPSPRVSDYRRAVLMSSTRKLQTMSQLMQVRRTRGEYIRALDKLDEDRRVQLIREHRDVIIKLALEKTKLEAAEEKLRTAGLPVPRQTDGSDRLEISIIRGRGIAVDRLIAHEDFELMPGDVIEVSFNGEHTRSVNLGSTTGTFP